MKKRPPQDVRDDSSFEAPKIFDSIPAFVFVKDTSNNILFANKVVADSLEVSPDALRNTPSSRWYPDHAHLYYDDDKEVVRTARPKLGIIEPKRTTSGEVLLRTDKYPIQGDAGDVSGVLVIGSVSHSQEEKRVANAAETLLRLVRGSARDVEDFITVATGFADLVDLESRTGASPRRHIRDFRASIAQAQLLLRGLAAVERAGRPTLSRTDLLQAIINEMPQVYRRKATATEVMVFSDCDSLEVGISAESVGELLLVLTENAFDAIGSTAGRVEIHVGETKRSEGSFATLTVSDSGPGIPASIRSRIFEPFFSTKTPRSLGGGLGLTVAQLIVRGAGGEISADDDDGKGATLRVLLPALQPDAR